MTSEQQRSIRTLRAAGQTTGQIAAALGLSINSVKSFLRRERQKSGLCKQCGRALTQQAGKKTKLFCCDRCRWAWWNHRRQHTAQH